MFRVLVAVDDDEQRATKQADAVSSMPMNPDDVEVTVVHAVTDRAGSRELQDPDRIQTVRRVARRLEDEGYTVHEEDAGDEVAREILRVADEIDADLVVLGGRKRTPTQKVLFGSVTQSVLLGTDRPVIVTGGET